MSSTVKVIAIVLVTTWAGGCASMEEKERASSNDESKAEFEAVFKDLSLQLKEELFERYFGMRRSDFENRKIYTELNPEIIRTIPDDKLEQAIRDFTYAAIKDDLDNIETKIPALGPGFSAVYFVSTAEREVSNGGFNQLFFNEGRRARS